MNDQMKLAQIEIRATMHVPDPAPFLAITAPADRFDDPDLRLLEAASIERPDHEVEVRFRWTTTPALARRDAAVIAHVAASDFHRIAEREGWTPAKISIEVDR